MSAKKEVVNVPKWLMIPLVMIIFGGGGWSSVMQYQIAELSKARKEEAKKVRAIEEKYQRTNQLINNNLTKLNANVITIANAKGIKLPFDNSRSSSIANDATVN